MPGIYLLGNLQFKSDDGTLLDVDIRRKTRALLAYVCLAEKAVSREQLSNLFCRNARDPMGSLRWHISRIRRNFHDQALYVSDDDVYVNLSVLTVDASTFLKALASSKQSSTDELENTLKLYRGEVLAGYSLPEETEFELWLLGQRAHFAQLYEKKALLLIEQLVANGAYDKALTWAKTLLNHNSTLEDAHYWLMWLYACTGQTSVALQQYEMYESHLLRELGAYPSDRLTQLAEQIRQQDLPKIVVEERPTLVEKSTAQMTPFVGRSQELDQLRKQWQAVTGGEGRTVIIQADAGMGKSALVRQFTLTLPRYTPIYTGTCYASTMASALAPWIKVIRDCFESLGDDRAIDIPMIVRARLSLLLPDLVTVDEQTRDILNRGDLNAHLLLNTIVDFLSVLATKQPFVIILEDFHFADENSVQLLSLLLNRLQQIPVLVLVTQRIAEINDNDALKQALHEWQMVTDWIRLDKLDDAHIAELIERILPGIDDKDAFRRRLVDHTLGISMHMVEVLQSCKSQPELLHDLPVPLSFSTLVEQRLQKMSPSQRQLLETLAVLEHPATLNEILEITGENEVETIQNLDRTMGYRFIQAATDSGRATYSFVHFLYRDVLLATISSARQQLLHRRAALVLERLAAMLPDGQRAEIVTRVVNHARHAEDVDRLLRWVPIAAETARTAFAHRQALALYDVLDSALQQTPRLSPDDYVGLLMKKVFLLRLLGDWKSQAAELQRISDIYATTNITNANLRLDFLVEYGTNLFRLGEYAEAITPLTEAILLGENADEKAVVAQAHNTLGSIAYYRSDWDAAETYYSEALKLRQIVGDDIGVGKGYNNLGAVAYHRGNYEQAAEYYRKNMEIREANNDIHGIATSLNNIGTVLITFGRWDEAMDHFQRALELRKKLDDKHGIASTLKNMAQISALQRRDQDAIDYHLESLSISEAIDDVNGVAHSLEAIGDIYISSEQYDLAIDYLQRSLTIRRKLGNRLGMAECMADIGYAQALKTRTYPGDIFFEALNMAHEIDNNHMMCLILEKLAWVMLSMGGDLLQVARYVGLTDAQRLDQRRNTLDFVLSALRSQLDEDTLQTEMQHGAQMNLRQTVKDLLDSRQIT
ncbi:MAG: tetratricopeptide repeat protein [Anaerolineaceae bacterium]|nr:tetratricopeptide repeat protein [Anaerolineaceae bacterium]